MAVGKSRQVVIEIETKVNEAVHLAIRRKGMTLKEELESKVREDFPDVYECSQEKYRK